MSYYRNNNIGIRVVLAPAQPPHRTMRRMIDRIVYPQESTPMKEIEVLEKQIRSLPREQALQLQDWLADYLEDQAELNPESIASIERGKADLREGRVRIRKP